MEIIGLDFPWENFNKKLPESEGHFWNFPSPKPQAEGEENFINAPEDKGNFL